MQTVVGKRVQRTTTLLCPSLTLLRVREKRAQKHSWQSSLSPVLFMSISATSLLEQLFLVGQGGKRLTYMYPNSAT